DVARNADAVTQKGIYAADGSLINARRAHSRYCTQFDYAVLNGSQINAHDVEGSSLSYSQALNTLTNDGVIFG
uniref:hypothetical protein n=1 Tax=Pseudovibrio sp. POLY-S9 TaxID=1576596 RepID=UPI000A9CCF1C